MNKTFLVWVWLALFASDNVWAERFLVKMNGQWSVQLGKGSDFNNNPQIEWVEKDQKVKVKEPQITETTDPKLTEQWSLKKTGVIDALKLMEQRSQVSNEIIVAVIDTGVDLKHADIKNNLFINQNEILNNNIDDDHNGFVDDVQGWNFAAHEDDREADPITEQNNAQDDYHHGTHVAGIIGAIQNNGIGISGIAPKVKILPIRWMKKGLGWGSDAILAIRYATKMGAKIINASWGGIGYSKALEEAVREAESKGVLFVVSAGNNHTDNDTVPRHPANLRFSNVISVANTDEKDGLAKSSNFGRTQVELAAPGENIVSTTLNQGYGKMSGSSMAAPHVSGIAALLLSAEPSLTGQEIKKILIKTVTPFAHLENKTVSGGRVNAFAALKDVLTEKKKPFYEFGQILPTKIKSVGFIKPDRIDVLGSAQGLFIEFVRLVKGKEIPVEGIAFKAQLHSGGTPGNYQNYISNEQGFIADTKCQRDEFTATATLESRRFSVVDKLSPYDLVLKLKCGIHLKLVFEEKSDAGQVVGIWQIASRAEKKLDQEVGTAFWKDRIEFHWPDQGDYYDGASVHLTYGHQWDVVSHEMGHAIYHRAKIGVSGGGEHYIDRCYDEALALSEGWASFYASWLNFDLNHPDPGFEYMVPRRAPIHFENIPVDVCGKSTNEWRVNGFLWDLIDQHNDLETFEAPFSALWRETMNVRASSIGSMKTHLIDTGWNAQRLDTIWKLNFPAE